MMFSCIQVKKKKKKLKREIEGSKTEQKNKKN